MCSAILYFCLIINCLCDEVRLVSLFGPSKLEYIGIERAANDECNIDSIKDTTSSSSSYNYWYQYSKLELRGNGHLVVVQDIIYKNLTEYYPVKQTYFNEPYNYDDYTVDYPLSCSTSTHSNIFTCFGANYNNTQGTYCHIYDNQKGKWLSKPLLINTQNSKDQGSIFQLKCFSDIFLIIWHNLDTKSSNNIIVSGYFYTLIDGNTFQYIQQNASIFEELAIDFYFNTMIASSKYNINQLLFVFNNNDHYDVNNKDPFRVYIYSYHYQAATKSLELDNYATYDLTIPIGNDYIEGISSAFDYQVFNGSSTSYYWVLPIGYGTEIDFCIFDAYSLKQISKYRFEYLWPDTDYGPWTSQGPVFSLDMINDNNNNTDGRYYFGLITNVFMGTMWDIGGWTKLNFTAFTIDTNKNEIELLNHKIIVDDENDAKPGEDVYIICAHILPKSNELFVSWFAKMNAKTPYGQVWQVSLE